MASETSVRKRLAVVLLVVVLLGTLPTGVAAQSESTVGGTVVVGEGETIDELEAVAGTVVVEGTVTGDVSAAAGDVRIESGGEVGGDLENRWLALVVGMIGGAILAQLPFVGGLLNFLILLLGLGALAWGLYAHRRTAGAREPGRRDRIGPDEPASD
ncbi:hypothetical protein [Natronococcus sp.]|uniref:hypothetical protein n=1 Tax=Natronococcus sp. TaxID=35747 RepID=UPI003A4DB23A